MKKKVLILCMALAAVSCYDDAILTEAVELGALEKVVTVEEEGGEVLIPFYSNQEGEAALLDEAAWAALDHPSFSSDGSLKVNVRPNDGFRRAARIILSSASRKDTVLLRQKGIIDTLSVSSSSVIVYNGMGDTELPAEGNIPVSAVKGTVRYLDADADPWVKAFLVRDDAVVVRTEDNPSAEAVRSAVLTLSWTNGWRQKVRRDINLTQARSAASGNLIGQPVSFGDLRAMAGDDPVVINGDFYIEGYIVSDNASGNVTENPRRTSTDIDYTATERTAMLESADGKYGFLLETVSEEDNVFDAYSKVMLLLDGAQLRRLDNPQRYMLSNIRAAKVASSRVVGIGGIPVKRMHIRDLKDDDIYTRVTLEDCEFPIRKGSLTPLNEGYTFLYNADRVSKFASLVRDVNGSSLYLYTNTTCPYRRDGRRIGYGRGTVSGVVVHEKFRSFIDGDAATEDECGNIGRYQIRHQSREDLAFADSFEDSFSGLVCEWRYLRQGNADHSWSATAGEGTMTHTYSAATPNSQYNTYCFPVYDQSYLGPVFKGCTNENGFGSILDDGSDYASSYKGSVDRGQLLGTSGWPMAWMREYWVDGSGDFHAWVIHFSTADIRTDVLSLQVSTLNASQEGMSPVHWKVQWAETNTLSTVWKDIATYSVPDIVLWTMTQPWQSGGYKPMDFVLPEEMLGKEDVYVRLIPADRKGNSPQGYCDSNFKNGTAGSSSKANNAINYIAVRYNK